MKKMSFTLFRSDGWVSALGRSAFLVLFAWCLSLAPAHGQCTFDPFVPNTIGGILTGSGSTAPGTTFQSFLDCLAPNYNGPSITDPCSCSGEVGSSSNGGTYGGVNIFNDDIIVFSPSATDVWVYQGAVPGVVSSTGIPLGAFTVNNALTTPVAAGTVIPLVGSTTDVFGVTQYIYQLSIQHPADEGYTAVVTEQQGRYLNIGLNTLTIGARCFDIDKSTVDLDVNTSNAAGGATGPVFTGSTAGTNLGVVDIDDFLNCQITFPAAPGAGLNSPAFNDGGTYTLAVNGETVRTGTYEYGDVIPANLKEVARLALCNNSAGQTISLTYDPVGQPTIGYFNATDFALAQIVGAGEIDLNNNGIPDASDLGDGDPAVSPLEASNYAFVNARIAARQGAGGCPVTCSVDFDVDFCPDAVGGGVDDGDADGDDVAPAHVNLGGTAYDDTQNHRITICPDDPDDGINPNKHYVRFNFNPSNFNVSQNDVVTIYDGTFGCGGSPTAIWTNNGEAISGSIGLPNGGWIDATCNNDSGCLTFEFVPKDDGNKGSYTFTHEKRSREAIVNPLDDAFETGKCNHNNSGFVAANHTIQTLEADCSYDPTLAPTANGTQIAIFDANGVLLYASGPAGAIVTEDLDADGILDAGEDVNMNGKLDVPGTRVLTRVDPQGDASVANGGANNPGGTGDDNSAADLLRDEYLDSNDNGTFDMGEPIFLIKGEYTISLCYWEQNPLTAATIVTESYDVWVSGIEPVCNDQINVDLGGECSIWLSPDDVLENMCAGGNTVYEVTIDGDEAVLDACGTFEYQVVSYMDMNGDGDQDSNDPTLGTCWGNVLVENKTPASVSARLKTLAERTADRNRACVIADSLDVVAATAVADSAWADVAVANAADVLANAQAAAALYPSNQVLADNETAAQTALNAAWAEGEATAAAAITALDAATVAEERCDRLNTLLGTTGGVLIACDIDDIDESEIFEQIAVSTKGICDLANVSLELTSLDGDECAVPRTAIITVTATTDTEGCNKTATTTINVPVIRPGVIAPGDVAFSCGQSSEPSNTGYPKLDMNGNGTWDRTEPDVTDAGYSCNYIMKFEDEVFESCGAEGRKIYRTWTLLDWCANNPAPSVIGRQLIEISDMVAPVFDEGQDAPTTVSVGHFSCTVDLSSEALPTATDDCSEVTVAVLDVARIVDGGFVAMSNDALATLDVDSFRVRYFAQDECQPVRDTLTRIVVVADEVAPQPQCDDEIIVSLGSDWGRITADDINEGSYDNCGIVSLQVSTTGADADDFADAVQIDCNDLEDVHEPVYVWLKATDAAGNSNVCWSTMTLQDKIAPVCEAPADQTVSCTEAHFPTDGIVTPEFEAFLDAEYGTAICEDQLGCITVEISGETTIESDGCGRYTITRTWRGTDWNNTSDDVTQTITVEYTPGWEITLPADTDVLCMIGEDGPTFSYDEGDIDVAAGSCDNIGVEVEAREFIANEGACKKLEITYHIINWCIYSPGDAAVALPRDGEASTASSADYADASYLTYTRIMKLVDNVAPVVTDIAVDDLCINSGCNDEATWTAWADDCVGEADLTWTATVYEVGADGSRTAVATGGALNSDGFWAITAPIENKKSYQAEFWAADGCGNSGGGTSDVEQAWDCKQPTPYALNGIAISLMPTGMVAVWASDLDQGSFDNCGDVVVSIKKAGSDDAPASSITFECNDLGTQSVELHVTDEEGHSDFVSTYVIIQDNLNMCPGGSSDVGQVAGSVLNAEGAYVEDVAVSVNGSMATMSTENNGAYSFTLPTGEDYTITPEKNVNPLNGVSTFDLVLISKHILGIAPFDTPYKYIAADVNKSGSITAFDMVQLRQLILNITTEFPNNTSWRFVDAAHQFGMTPLGENFNEFISINDLAGNMANVNFVAVKVGDVNGNAQPNSLVASDVRTAGTTLTLTTQDQFVEAGQTVSVAFTAADIATVAGYQFTMNYAGLELAQLVDGVATAENFNTNLRGKVATSWNGAATANDVLFTLNFKATTAGNLSELLSVSSDAVAAEAYTATGEVMEVAINFTTSEGAVFGLEQNIPNPFNGETVIGFTLPQAGQATLKVMDIQGKVIKSYTNDYTKGYNQISVNAKELGATGVLHYQLESADNVATKKMIIIE